jgi:cob(I)alamin adenosyltransferase
MTTSATGGIPQAQHENADTIAAFRPEDQPAPRGYVHVYTGKGKGKTTAAMGLALRAAGHGKRVFIGQFMKSGTGGEVAALRAFPKVSVEQFGRSPRDSSRHVCRTREQRAHDGLLRSREILESGDYDVVILDEIDVAICCGLLTTDDCHEMLDSRPSQVELVLTGRSAPQAILERADLVTEMREVRHYYHAGAAARAGIEY